MNLPRSLSLGAWLVAAMAMMSGGHTGAWQNPPASADPALTPAGPVALRMIVVSTPEEAAGILDQLRQGADFAALAVEKSIEPTARDGGYLGIVDPATLRPALRDALNGVRPGELTRIVRITSGYAILKVVPASESSGRPNASPLQMLSASASSVVYAGISVGGLAEADAVFLAVQKPAGWEQDLQMMCEVRRQSLPRLIDRLKAAPAS